MAESSKPEDITPAPEVLGSGPLVFISHDSRDAELAEAFGKLLKSVSAGMIKTFRSTDKKGADGIDFGEEWYKRLMNKLQSTSDVVCLFTERSLDRPWILFEAGVAKGKLDTPVVGIALGVSLTRVSAGPFYQFQNMDDSKEDLTKLVHQLARRVPGLELDADVVKSQVQAFKATEETIVSSLASAGGKKALAKDTEERSLAKLAEEMKTLPSRVAERLASEVDPLRRRRMHRFHPMMLEELMHSPDGLDDPISILMAASLFRDDMPWLYELSMEVYRAVKTGNIEDIMFELGRLRRFTDLMHRGPLGEFLWSKEHHMVAMEFPRMLERFLRSALDMKETRIKGRPKIPRGPKKADQ